MDEQETREEEFRKYEFDKKMEFLERSIDKLSGFLSEGRNEKTKLLVFFGKFLLVLTMIICFLIAYAIWMGQNSLVIRFVDVFIGFLGGIGTVAFSMLGRKE